MPPDFLRFLFTDGLARVLPGQTRPRPVYTVVTFRVDGRQVSTDYPRFDSPHITAERDPETLTFEHDGKRLHLDFYRMVRQEAH